MDDDEIIQETIRTVLKRNRDAARLYNSLSDSSRQSVLAALDKPGKKALTSLLKQAKKHTFAVSHRRFLALRNSLSTPVYLLDESLIEENMRVLRYVKDRTGCKILHALKAYASFSTFPMMSTYIDGISASGVNEARLGREEFGKEVHTFGAAYSDGEFEDIVNNSNVVIFNSFYQLRKFSSLAMKKRLQIGIRVNPGYSEVATEMYNPCAPRSRLGVTNDVFIKDFDPLKDKIDGIHFHAMCEQNSDVLERIVKSFIHLFGSHIKGLKWVNFGGGHHITRSDYDIERLIKIISDFKKRYPVQVYLEPGEASVLKSGVLISTVLDIVHNDMGIAIIDASAETHMSDVLLMPYKPHIMTSGEAGQKNYTYRIAGPSCLAGDIIGDYSFSRPLRRGNRIVFTDMALYSIVKNTTFNGINLPGIAVIRTNGIVERVKDFDYHDYRDRQG